MLTNDDIHAFLCGWGRDLVNGIVRGIQPRHQRMMRRKIRRMARRAD